jgi:hypothetical protein
MEDKKLHPVTELLLARMESHPEEFRDPYLMSQARPTYGEGRWEPAIRGVQQWGAPEDTETLNAKIRGIYMDQAHEWVMDELLNGEERRRKEQSEREYYEQKKMQAYANTLPGQYMQVSGQEALRIDSTGSLGIGTTATSQSLDSAISTGIKKALGL